MDDRLRAGRPYTISVCNQPTRSTQPCIPPGSLNWAPASVRVRARMSPLPGGRKHFVIPYGMWVPVAVRLVVNCCTPFSVPCLTLLDKANAQHNENCTWQFDSELSWLWNVYFHDVDAYRKQTYTWCKHTHRHKFYEYNTSADFSSLFSLPQVSKNIFLKVTHKFSRNW